MKSNKQNRSAGRYQTPINTHYPVSFFLPLFIRSRSSPATLTRLTFLENDRHRRLSIHRIYVTRRGAVDACTATSSLRFLVSSFPPGRARDPWADFLRAKRTIEKLQWWGQQDSQCLVARSPFSVACSPHSGWCFVPFSPAAVFHSSLERPPEPSTDRDQDFGEEAS